MEIKPRAVDVRVVLMMLEGSRQPEPSQRWQEQRARERHTGMLPDTHRDGTGPPRAGPAPGRCPASGCFAAPEASLPHFREAWGSPTLPGLAELGERNIRPWRWNTRSRDPTRVHLSGLPTQGRRLIANDLVAW